ncbi:zinc ABC transporter substrate-binding protein [Agrococcus sediminis]|uniref:Zinc ABC transporter substrate-binding protein n=1 Tax=Agrococcus sediminis TaxID=2599924 RepID=A0A5M8QMV7_9MICO|nr:metal ABC transporter substrate-binding protein [Agrococcus sediminis]KAA6436076.1 zinc ABC transporter substrate-binding protein [Agrococcus sediminis]
MRTLTAAGAIGAMALAVTGCAGAANGAGSAGDRLEIVTTTTQLADITSELVGDAAEVTSLLQPGASAHSFDPGPAALGALADADLLIVNGAGLEEWLGDTVEASGFAGTVVDTSEPIDLLEAGEEADAHAGEDEDAHADEAEGEEHAEEAPTEPGHEGETAEEHAEHADEGEETVDEPGHEGETAEEHAAHGEFDPHVWTDPANAILQAQAIRDAVTAADPEADIDASADAYIAQLGELEEWMRASIEQVPVDERLVVTTHDTFGYLERAFDVQVVGTVLPSLDDSADASAAHIDELVAEIRETGAPVVFSENAIDPQLAATIAREAGVELRQGEDALAADALGAEGTPTGTYIGSLVHNTTAMVTAWGAEPLPVPESLS